MDIQKEKNAFLGVYVCYQGDSREIQFNEETDQFMWRKNNVSDSEVEYVHLMNQRWYAWLECAKSKANAVPDGFVLVEKSKVHTWYQDDESPENYCHSESDLDCLGDCLDDDDIITVNIHESAHISTRKVFGVWKSNSPTDIQSKFVLIDSRAEAEEIVTANKAMFKVQEQSHD